MTLQEEELKNVCNMGLPHRILYATNVNREDGWICLSAWKPIFRDGEYYYDNSQPIGGDMMIPNVLNLTFEDGIVPVKIVKSDVETGLWLVCFNDYFGNEKHLFNYKPKTFVDKYGEFKVNFDSEDDANSDDWSMHVACEIDMVAGDGPIPVTLERGTYENPKTSHEEKKEKFNLFKKFGTIFDRKKSK